MYTDKLSMYATNVVEELAGIEPWTLRISIMSCALYQLRYKCGIGIGCAWHWVGLASGGFGLRWACRHVCLGVGWVECAVAQMVKFKEKRSHTHTHTREQYLY